MNLPDEPKALVLAAGRGKRLSEFTEDVNKAMLTFGNRHLIEYSLDNAVSLGVQEIVIVVGYQADQIRSTFGDSYRGVPVKYVLQAEQRGVVHAIECSQAIIGETDFLLLLADEFFLRPEHPAFLRYFREERAFAVCGIVYVQDPQRIRKTYSVQADAETRRVFRLIEKPANPVNNIMGTGNILFRKDIFRYVPLTPVHPQRGEKELPALIQCAIDDGHKVLFFPLASAYANVNTSEDLSLLIEEHSR